MSEFIEELAVYKVTYLSSVPLESEQVDSSGFATRSGLFVAPGLVEAAQLAEDYFNGGKVEGEPHMLLERVEFVGYCTSCDDWFEPIQSNKGLEPTAPAVSTSTDAPTGEAH